MAYRATASSSIAHATASRHGSIATWNIQPTASDRLIDSFQSRTHVGVDVILHRCVKRCRGRGKAAARLNANADRSRAGTIVHAVARVVRVQCVGCPDTRTGALIGRGEESRKVIDREIDDVGRRKRIYNQRVHTRTRIRMVHVTFDHVGPRAAFLRRSTSTKGILERKFGTTISINKP